MLEIDYGEYVVAVKATPLILYGAGEVIEEDNKFNRENGFREVKSITPQAEEIRGKLDDLDVKITKFKELSLIEKEIKPSPDIRRTVLGIIDSLVGVFERVQTIYIDLVEQDRYFGYVKKDDKTCDRIDAIIPNLRRVKGRIRETVGAWFIFAEMLRQNERNEDGKIRKED
jgi:hypothetical protein